MDWMGGDRPAVATRPDALEPGCRSVIVVAAPYAGRERAAWDPDPAALREALAPVLAGEPAAPVGRIARYALGTDYHQALRHRLEMLASDMRREGLPTGEVAYVDDRPLAERALAARAGLGWIGKNANLLTHSRAGSWVFLGALLTSAELPTDRPMRTTCGACTRCISACPTGAIVAPHTVDARRCISYLTIEHAGVLDEREAGAIRDWIFGCDVCQEACPVNGEAEDEGALAVPLLPLMEWLLAMSGRAFARTLGRTALTRAGRHRLLRNAIAALANSGDRSDATRDLLERATDDARIEIRAQARLALASIG
jgi:epoxyqueuosine reductase